MAISKAKIKLYRSLHQKKGRREEQRFIIEGADLIKEALSEGWPVEEVFLTHYFGKEVMYGQDIVQLSGLAKIPCDFCSQKELDQMTDTPTPQGAVALARMPELDATVEPESPEVMLICGQVSDPGNMGTLLRTADWFGLSSIILGEGSVDIYSPKVVRSSAGSIFRVKVEISGQVDGLIVQEVASGRKIFAADMNGQLEPKDLPATGKRGLYLGHERKGVSPEILALCSDSVRIPNKGRAESLNLGVAAGILLYSLTSG